MSRWPTDPGIIAAPGGRSSEEDYLARLIVDDIFNYVDSLIGAVGKGYYVDFPVLQRILDCLGIA